MLYTSPGNCCLLIWLPLHVPALVFIPAEQACFPKELMRRLPGSAWSCSYRSHMQIFVHLPQLPAVHCGPLQLRVKPSG